MAEELHFHRAAERLHVAQPSLSQQIRRFEAQLGVTLLHRTSRRVELTDAGRTMLARGRALLAAAEDAADATRSAGADAITVGFYGSAGMALLSPTVSAFAAEHPATSVRVRELLFGDLDDLVEGRVDLAFTRLLPHEAGDRLHTDVLAREPRHVALAAGHSLADRPSLALRDLAGEAFIINPAVRGRPAARWLGEQARHGLPARVAAHAASVPELLTLVATGRGVALVPSLVTRHYRRDDIRYVPAADADPAVVSLVRRRDAARPAAGAFAETARRVAARQDVAPVPA